MKSSLLLLVGLLSILTVFASAQASGISLSSDVTLRAGERITFHWDAPNTLFSLSLMNGSFALNDYELSASTWINITITRWPEPGEEFRKIFVFRANTTQSTSVQFNVSGPTDEDIGSWSVLRDGISLASGGNENISFIASEWQTAVDRTFQITAEFIGEAQGWIQQYGSAWAALLVAGVIFALIIGAFYTNIKRRKRSGKVWKFMPRKWRR